MPPITLSLLAAAATISAVYSYFSGKSTDDDKPDSSSASSSGYARTTRPSHTSPLPLYNSRTQTTTITPTSSDHTHNRDSYYHSFHTPTTHTADSSQKPSVLTHSQPSYQQQPIYPRAAQAATKTKENLESSDHIHRHGPASSRQTLPTSATHSHASASTQSTHSRNGQAAYLLKLQRASLSSYHAGESRQTPPTYATRAQAANLTQSTPSRVGQPTSTTSDHLDPLHRASLASSHAGSRQTPSIPAHTYASYPAQQTSARVGQTTVRTPTADYDSGMRRSGLTSQDFEESHVVYPASPPALSSYSYQRAPSPDATRVQVSRLTVSPKKHSRTQSSSSDSDYLGPSSHTRAVPRSWSPFPDVLPDPDVDDAVANAKDNKKAIELRERARSSTREMLDARDRAKSARRRGDRVAESDYKQQARAHESTMKNLNKNAAKIIFRLKNQVRGKPCVEVPMSHSHFLSSVLGSRGRNSRPPRSVCRRSRRVRKKGTPIRYV
jgi:hypothetical protein